MNQFKIYLGPFSISLCIYRNKEWMNTYTIYKYIMC